MLKKDKNKMNISFVEEDDFSNELSVFEEIDDFDVVDNSDENQLQNDENDIINQYSNEKGKIKCFLSNIKINFKIFIFKLIHNILSLCNFFKNKKVRLFSIIVLITIFTGTIGFGVFYALNQSKNHQLILLKNPVELQSIVELNKKSSVELPASQCDYLFRNIITTNWKKSNNDVLVSKLNLKVNVDYNKEIKPFTIQLSSSSNLNNKNLFITVIENDDKTCYETDLIASEYIDSMLKNSKNLANDLLKKAQILICANLNKNFNELNEYDYLLLDYSSKHNNLNNNNENNSSNGVVNQVNSFLLTNDVLNSNYNLFGFKPTLSFEKNDNYYYNEDKTIAKFNKQTSELFSPCNLLESNYTTSSTNDVITMVFDIKNNFTSKKYEISFSKNVNNAAIDLNENKSFFNNYYICDFKKCVTSEYSISEVTANLTNYKFDNISDPSLFYTSSGNKELINNVFQNNINYSYDYEIVFGKYIICLDDKNCKIYSIEENCLKKEIQIKNLENISSISSIIQSNLDLNTLTIFDGDNFITFDENLREINKFKPSIKFLESFNKSYEFYSYNNGNIISNFSHDEEYTSVNNTVYHKDRGIIYTSTGSNKTTSQRIYFDENFEYYFVEKLSPVFDKSNRNIKEIEVYLLKDQSLQSKFETNIYFTSSKAIVKGDYIYYYVYYNSENVLYRIKYKNNNGDFSLSTKYMNDLEAKNNGYSNNFYENMYLSNNNLYLFAISSNLADGQKLSFFKVNLNIFDEKDNKYFEPIYIFKDTIINQSITSSTYSSPKQISSYLDNQGYLYEVTESYIPFTNGSKQQLSILKYKI